MILLRSYPALFAAGAFFVLLAIFGARAHWVEEAGTAERDGYVAMAEEILAGQLPDDAFRPLLYPLLIAGGALAGLEPFTAARSISNLAAAAVAWLAWSFGLRLGGRRVGWLAMAAAMANSNLWILGQHAATDMLFAALAGGSLLAAWVYWERPGKRPALAAGALFGAAAFVRGNAVFLLPGLAAAWWLAGRTGGRSRPRERLLEAGAGATAAVGVLMPQWILSFLRFGSPFHDENWKNLAWKLYGFPDWSSLDRLPFEGLWEVIVADPVLVLAAGLGELGRFGATGLTQLIGTPLHAVALIAGCIFALVLRRRTALWLLFTVAAFVAGVALSFFTWGRLLLPVLPPFEALVFFPLGAAASEWMASRLGWNESRRGTVRRLALSVAAGLIALAAVKTFAFRVPAFVERHPYGEIAALRAVQGQAPPEAALAALSPFLGRYLDRPYLSVPDAFGPELEEPALWYERVRPLLEEAGAAYLVADRVDLRDRPLSLLGPEAPVPWLRAVGSPEIERDRLAVWRVALRDP